MTSSLKVGAVLSREQYGMEGNRSSTQGRLNTVISPVVGVVQATKEVGLKIPLIVRLEGTNVAEGKEIIKKSGLNIISADDLDDAAKKACASL